MRGDFSARVSLAYSSPPEVRETKLAFNHMADHVSSLVAALERGHNELLVEKERLRVTIESIGDAVVVTDADGIIEFINPKAEELTGFSSGDARGRRVTEVLPLFHEQKIYRNKPKGLSPIRWNWRCSMTRSSAWTAIR